MSANLDTGSYRNTAAAIELRRCFLSQEVFDQNSQTHDDQNEPAEKLGACLVAITEDTADFDADDASNEGCQAD